MNDITERSFTSRQYQGEDDYQRIRELLVDIYAMSGPPDYGTVGDLDWWRFTDNDPMAIEGVQLWFDEGERLCGAAWPFADQVELFIHPDRQQVFRPAIAWAEERAQLKTQGDTSSVTISSYDGDACRIAILKERGYVRTDFALLNWHRRFDGSEPPATVADGYRIRSFEGEREIEARVAVHRDAFAPSKMTVEKHRAVMGSPTYRQDLDLVVIAPDETIAAYCIVWYDAANRLGVFEPVGCHSNHRQRGLARSVILEGFRRLKRLGAESACVMSLATAEPAKRLYASVGFTCIDQMHMWKRTIVSE